MQAIFQKQQKYFLLMKDGNEPIIKSARKWRKGFRNILKTLSHPVGLFFKGDFILEETHYSLHCL